MALGIYLALFFPLFFILGGVFDIDINDSFASAIWISGFIVQGLAWIVLGVIILGANNKSVELSVESTGQCILSKFRDPGGRQLAP